MAARTHLEDARKLSFVSSISLDECMCEVVINGEEFTIMLPDEYPNGEPALFGALTATLRPGTIPELCQQTHDLLAKESQKAVESHPMVKTPALDDLSKDIAAFQQRFGASTAEVRSFESSDWVTIHIPVASLIDEATARAWGIKRSVPLTIQFKFSTKSYVEQQRPPTMELSQAGEKFPLGQQLTRNLSMYLERNWHGKWTPPFVGHLEKYASAQQQLNDQRNAPKVRDQPKVRKPLTGKKHMVYTQLVDMGFPDDYAEAAARKCASVEEALDFDPSTAKSSSDDDAAPTPSPKRGGGSNTNKHQVDPLIEKFKGGDTAKYDSATDPEKYVSYRKEQGFLCHIADVIQKRVPTSHKYCVICDKPHVFAGGAMLRASVCSRDVCVFAFQEFKVGGDAAESVATDGGVIDLLINIFRASVLSDRAETILKPFPHVFDPKNPSKAVFDPKSPDIAGLRRVTQHFPDVADLVGADDLNSLKLNLARKDPMAYPLLEWIINSNRSLIIKMDRKHHINAMKTPHQYLLVTAPPEKQRKFNEMKSRSGTVFAFHGSGIENWHAILRTGLRNASGTKLQLNGAAHGSGIYFAPQASDSLGYCRGSVGSGGGSNNKQYGDQFIDASGMICMALCEIIKGKPKDHGWCWTLEDEDAVVTRFFFAFDKNSGQDVAANTKDGSFIDQVKSTLRFYNID